MNSKGSHPFPFPSLAFLSEYSASFSYWSNSGVFASCKISLHLKIRVFFFSPTLFISPTLSPHTFLLSVALCLVCLLEYLRVSAVVWRLKALEKPACCLALPCLALPCLALPCRVKTGMSLSFPYESNSGNLAEPSVTGKSINMRHVCVCVSVVRVQDHVVGCVGVKERKWRVCVCVRAHVVRS